MPSQRKSKKHSENNAYGCCFVSKSGILPRSCRKIPFSDVSFCRRPLRACSCRMYHKASPAPRSQLYDSMLRNRVLRLPRPPQTRQPRGGEETRKRAVRNPHTHGRSFWAGPKNFPQALTNARAAGTIEFVPWPRFARMAPLRI